MALKHFKYILSDDLGEFGYTFLVNTGLKNRLKPSPDVRLDGQVAIVTGGNRGIGKVISTELASRGAKVIIACRDTEKAQETINEIKRQVETANVDVHKIDLASFASVREFAKNVLNSEPRIDILVNNAGVTSTKRVETVDKNELLLQVNCYSPILLACLLADRLSKSPNGRVVSVSSLAHGAVKTLHMDDLQHKAGKYQYVFVYGHSKLGLMVLTRYLSRKLAGKVKVYAADPGVAITDFFDNMTTFDRISTKAMGIFTRPVSDSGMSIVSAVLDSSEVYQPGQNYYMVDCQFKPPSPYASSDEAADTFWKIFKETTGVDEP